MLDVSQKRNSPAESPRQGPVIEPDSVKDALDRQGAARGPRRRLAERLWAGYKECVCERENESTREKRESVGVVTGALL